MLEQKELTDNNFEELLDAEDQYGEAWRPAIGDKLIGTIVRYGKYQGDYGQTIFVLIRDDEGDLHSVYLNSTVLFKCFAELKPKVGERIGLKRLESNKNYKKFKVLVDRPELLASGGSIEPDWNQISPRSNGSDGEATTDEDTSSDVPF